MPRSPKQRTRYTRPPNRTIALVLGLVLASLTRRSNALTVQAANDPGRCEALDSSLLPSECAGMFSANERVFIPAQFTQQQLVELSIYDAGLDPDDQQMNLTVSELFDDAVSRMVEPGRTIAIRYHCWQLFRPCVRHNAQEYATWMPLCEQPCEMFSMQSYYLYNGRSDSSFQVCQTMNPLTVEPYPFGINFYPALPNFDLELPDGAIISGTSCRDLTYNATVTSDLDCNPPALHYPGNLDDPTDDHLRDTSCRFSCPLMIFPKTLERAAYVLQVVLAWPSFILSAFLTAVLLINPRTRAYPANLLLAEVVGIVLLSLGMLVPSFRGPPVNTWCGGNPIYPLQNYTDIQAFANLPFVANWEHQYGAACPVQGVFSHLGLMIAVAFWLLISISTFLRLKGGAGAKVSDKEQYIFFALGFALPVAFVVVLGAANGESVTDEGRQLSNYRYSLYTLNCFPALSTVWASLTTFYLPTFFAICVGTFLYGSHLYRIFETTRRTSGMKSKSAKQQRQTVFLRIAVFEGIYLLTFSLLFGLEVQYYKNLFDNEDSSTGRFLQKYLLCVMRGFDSTLCADMHGYRYGPVVMVNIFLSIQGIVVFMLFFDRRLFDESIGKRVGLSTATTRSRTTGSNSVASSTGSKGSSGLSSGAPSSRGGESASSSVDSSSFASSDSAGGSSSFDSTDD